MTDTHRSVAVWPDTISVGNVEGKNESSDTHHSKEAAEAVCRMLEQDGFGGMGKVFPTSTRVEEIKKCSYGLGTVLPCKSIATHEFEGRNLCQQHRILFNKKGQ